MAFAQLSYPTHTHDVSVIIKVPSYKCTPVFFSYLGMGTLQLCSYVFPLDIGYTVVIFHTNIT